jgi:hypothetical protein
MDSTTTGPPQLRGREGAGGKEAHIPLLGVIIKKLLLLFIVNIVFRTSQLLLHIMISLLG